MSVLHVSTLPDGAVHVLGAVAEVVVETEAAEVTTEERWRVVCGLVGWTAVVVGFVGAGVVILVDVEVVVTGVGGARDEAPVAVSPMAICSWSSTVT